MNAVADKYYPRPMQDETPDLKRLLIDGLDRILDEIGCIDRALVIAPRAEDLGAIREARRQAKTIAAAAQGMLTWVTETRLHPPAN